MKKLLGIALITVGLIGAAGCKEKEYNLTSATKTMSFEEAGGTETFVINGSNGQCILEHSPEWLAANVADSTVTVNVGPNEGSEKREYEIVIKCGISSISIPVSQYAKATKLELPDGNSLTLPREGGSKELAAVSDGLVKVETFEPLSAEWSNSVLKVSAPKNDGKRIKGKVKLIAGEFSKDVDVIIDGDFCSQCNGTGFILCKACKGKGMVWSDSDLGYYGCKSCGGRGYNHRALSDDWRLGTGKTTCPSCKGQG